MNYSSVDILMNTHGQRLQLKESFLKIFTFANTEKNMKITYKIACGRGTILAPTFRSYDVIHEIKRARCAEMGNLMQLYNFSGYTICSIPKEDILKIEK